MGDQIVHMSNGVWLELGFHIVECISNVIYSARLCKNKYHSWFILYALSL